MAKYTEDQKKKIKEEAIARYPTRESCAFSHTDVSDGGLCFYRNGEDRTDKRRCAVGALMPDDAPESILYHTGSVFSLVDILRKVYSSTEMPEWANDIIDNQEFLTQLQKAHDQYASQSTSYVSMEEAVRVLVGR